MKIGGKIRDGIIGFLPLTNAVLVFCPPNHRAKFHQIRFKTVTTERWQTHRQTNASDLICPGPNNGTAMGQINIKIVQKMQGNRQFAPDLRAGNINELSPNDNYMQKCEQQPQMKCHTSTKFCLQDCGNMTQWNMLLYRPEQLEKLWHLWLSQVVQTTHTDM